MGAGLHRHHSLLHLRVTSSIHRRQRLHRSGSDLLGHPGGGVTGSSVGGVVEPLQDPKSLTTQHHATLSGGPRQPSTRSAATGGSPPSSAVRLLLFGGRAARGLCALNRENIMRESGCVAATLTLHHARVAEERYHSSLPFTSFSFSCKSYKLFFSASI